MPSPTGPGWWSPQHHPVTLLSWKFSLGPSCCALASWQPGGSSHREPRCLRLAWAGLATVSDRDAKKWSGDMWRSLDQPFAPLKINQVL